MKTLLKTIFTIFITLVVIAPALFIAGAYGFLAPVGFLQSFFVIGLGVWFLGGTQIIFSIIWVFLMFIIWS